jgi:hypothetical protein
MIAFISLIALLCQQPGVGTGSTYVPNAHGIREQAFAAQSACIKRLYAACTTKHRLSGEVLPGKPECLVEKL